MNRNKKINSIVAYHYLGSRTAPRQLRTYYVYDAAGSLTPKTNDPSAYDPNQPNE